MNLKASLEEKPRLYVKKSVKPTLANKNSLVSMDLIDEEFQLGQNLGYCLTSANKEHSFLTDLLSFNLFNDSQSLETTAISQKIKLNQKAIDLIKEAIQYHLSNVTLFPIFQFSRGFTIVFHDQVNKLNDFVKEFLPYYRTHSFTKLLSKARMRFKIINPSKVAYLMKVLEKSSGRFFAKALPNSKGLQANGRGDKGNGKKLGSMTPIITMELLTKIPNKHPDKIVKNRRLEMQYGKAKEAAIGIRRLEYAYNMKKGFMFNKMLFQKNVITIQKWWRSVSRCINEFLVVSQIQSHFRGHLARIALSDSLHVVDDVLPLLKKVDNIMVRNRIEFFFNRLYRKYAYLAIWNKMSDKIDMIKRSIKAYIIRKGPKVEFSKHYVIKCNMLKHICEFSTQKRIDLLQSAVRFFLMHNSDKIMRGFGYHVHPYVYLKLKYGSYSQEVYKRKIVKFHRCFNKLQLFNLKVNKGIPNGFEYFRIAVTRKHFKDLVQNDKEYIHNRKHALLGKYLACLEKETKLQWKYLTRWGMRTLAIVQYEKEDRLRRTIKAITFARDGGSLRKYYDIWKRKKSLVYRMVIMFKKGKAATKSAKVYMKKRDLFNELFEEFNSRREGRNEIELRNSLFKWKCKVGLLLNRHCALTKAITHKEQMSIKNVQKKAMTSLMNKCKAEKRQSLMGKALSNKVTREEIELRKYLNLWKTNYHRCILHSIVLKTFSKEQEIMKKKLNQLNTKSLSLASRNNHLKQLIEYINDTSLLKHHLALFRNTTKQLTAIEVSLKKLVSDLTLKDNNHKLRNCYTKWKATTLMNRLIAKEHNRWLLKLLSKWRSFSYLLQLTKRILAKKDRMDSISLRKYLNRWKKHNEVYCNVVLPSYRLKTKLFEKILSEPINKRRTVHKSIAFMSIMGRAINYKAAIALKLKHRILDKHFKDIQTHLSKWEAVANNLIIKEQIKHKREHLLTNIFSQCSLKYSLNHLRLYFTQYRKKASYYICKALFNKHNQHRSLLQLYFTIWKKQSFKYKLRSASNVIINTVKARNHFRKFCTGFNHIFIMKLYQSAFLLKKRSQIQMLIYKNIFSLVRGSITYRNQLKALTQLSLTANQKFQTSLLRWRLKAKRIALTQRRFYSNVSRRLKTNNKKTVLCEMVKKVKDRREAQKGRFFKKFKQAAGVYYIKCSRLNSQVFFLYRQKKYLSKRKYRMIKYVINQVNRKLLKHQSLKRHLSNWRKEVRSSILIDCIKKRMKLLEEGPVALRAFIQKWNS